VAAFFDDVQRDAKLSMALLLMSPRHVSVLEKHFV